MTKSKLQVGRACDIYAGQVFKLGLKFAEKFGLKVLILSGKYGLIEPETVIENYDQVLTTYTGEWPTQKGYWLGGKRYFKNAPDNLQPLIVGHRGYGDMKNWLGKQIKNAI